LAPRPGLEPGTYGLTATGACLPAGNKSIVSFGANLRCNRPLADPANPKLHQRNHKARFFEGQTSRQSQGVQCAAHVFEIDVHVAHGG
jgi:hypothetical protein